MMRPTRYQVLKLIFAQQNNRECKEQGRHKRRLFFVEME